MSTINISAVTNATTAALQEATETLATTIMEAARGDQQAIRKLAKMQPETPTPTPEPGVGEAVDYSA